MSIKINDTIVLAAGGTGGHIFPAQALAEELIKEGYKPLLICDQRSTNFLKVPFNNENVIQIYISKPGRSLLSKAYCLMKLLPIIYNLRKILKSRNTKAVIGFGGYPSLPTILAALTLNIPLYIHEQNAVLGKVNRLMLPFVSTLFVSYPNTIKLNKKYRNKVLVVGNLVRANILRLNKQARNNKNSNFNILIIGGSLGAKVINDVVPYSLQKLPLKLRTKIKVFQQSKPDQIDLIKQVYKAAKIKCEIADFFHDMGTLLHNADLIISRAGASTVTEITLNQKPAILIPLKIAADNHQFYNAKYLSDQGAVITILEADLTIPNLTEKISMLLSSPKKLMDMTKAYKNISIYLDSSQKLISHIVN